MFVSGVTSHPTSFYRDKTYQLEDTEGPNLYSVFMATFMWVLPSCLVSKDIQNLTYASKKSYSVWHILPSILPSSSQGSRRCCSTTWNVTPHPTSRHCITPVTHRAWAQASRDLMSPAILLCSAAHTHLCFPHRTGCLRLSLHSLLLGKTLYPIGGHPGWISEHCLACAGR